MRDRVRAADSDEIRVDQRLIAEMVRPGTRVIDVGCGDGALLRYLAAHKQVDGRGIELSQAGVNACVAQGLSVVQGDADADLAEYPTQSFDYVILSQTLQATRKPREVLLQMTRIGRCGIVSFPNFGYWRARLQLLLRGRMPVTQTMNEKWFETPNIHLCTIEDFLELARELNLRIERSIALDHRGRPHRIGSVGALANAFGEQAIFMLCAA